MSVRQDFELIGRVYDGGRGPHPELEAASAAWRRQENAEAARRFDDDWLDWVAIHRDRIYSFVMERARCAVAGG